MLKKLFRKEEVRLFVLGLDASGKTTILYKMKVQNIKLALLLYLDASSLTLSQLSPFSITFNRDTLSCSEIQHSFDHKQLAFS